ncbi:predicted protein [Naegleria gruberi]|uniref:Predicted protein n=1 Tax=Naegleria gruberi TaxID=5762 RepID=D2UXM9_NAEGR|nr:uncharacterized protein NAEGRDRAFT_77692 [Naegleria gruberi]EFC50661.1 predicted protein [Naegleria gruberi]|eukprot:XP_002683405.1 predicted protein [Naegleria gruberi strain NEG-M]
MEEFSSMESEKKASNRKEQQRRNKIQKSKERDEQIIREKIQSPIIEAESENQMIEAPPRSLSNRKGFYQNESIKSSEKSIAERQLDTTKFNPESPESLVPFKSPRLVKLWRQGKIIPENIRERLRFEETTEGHMDIYLRDDPNWSQLTTKLLTPTSTLVQLDKMKMLSEETDIHKYFDNKPLTIKNFDYLIRCQAMQGKLELAEQTLEKIKSLGPSPQILTNILEKRKAAILSGQTEIDENDLLLPSEYTYNAVMTACAVRGDYKKAYGYLREMQSEYHISPTIVSYSIVVHAMVRAGKVDEAFQMVELMRSHNLPTDTVIHTDLIQGCIKKGDLERAWNHYMAMGMVYGIPHDEVTVTTMINACAMRGQAERAMMLFRRLEQQMMIEPTEVTFNTLIKAYSKRKELRHRVFELAEQMELYGYKPDIYTINSLINACADDGSVARMKKVLLKMKEIGIKPTEHTYNSVLSCFSIAQQQKGNKNLTKEQNQNISDALAVYEKMKETNLPISEYTLNSLLGVFTNALRVEKALELCKNKYTEHNLQPTGIAYTLLVRMYCRLKRTESALLLFDEMKQNGVQPTYQAYKHMIFRLVDEGYVEKAREFLKKMFEETGFKLSPSDIIVYKSKVAGAARLIKERKHEENVDEYIKSFIDLVDYDLTPKSKQ